MDSSTSRSCGVDVARLPEAQQQDECRPWRRWRLRMSVSCGPMKLETQNWIAAKTAPQMRTAGQTSSVAGSPLVTRIR